MPNQPGSIPVVPTTSVISATSVSRSRVRRVLWAGTGLFLVALGFVGVVVPGLPTTGFMILAAAAFSRSSPRLEAWLLGLPKIGPAVQAYRAGQGMPKRAKVVAIAMMWTAIAISCLLIERWLIRAVLIAAGLVGTVVIVRVPTYRPANCGTLDR